MVIALGATRSHYQYLYTLVASINKHNNPKKIYIFIEDEELNLPWSNVEYINMTTVGLDENGKNYTTGYSIASLVKLYFASVFANEDKIIWIDLDAIARKPLDELWNMNIDDYYLAGVVDSGIEKWHTPGLELDWSQYVNAGVLLFNLKKIREDDKEKELIELVNNQKLACPEQDALNVVFENNKLIIPGIWNAAIYTVGRYEPDPVIYHWAGGKPNWVYEREHAEWWTEVEAELDKDFVVKAK